jgi:D-alanyl-lipoteichoic acid acyltransferase DltB (MBOAT superfamily)
LWHGITVTFLVWGLWHGMGLFLHKLWTDRTRKWYNSLKNRRLLKQAWTIAGIFITFHFVVLGWVWFALPRLGLARDVLLQLFGG